MKSPRYGFTIHSDVRPTQKPFRVNRMPEKNLRHGNFFLCQSHALTRSGVLLQNLTDVRIPCSKRFINGTLSDAGPRMRISSAFQDCKRSSRVTKEDGSKKNRPPVRARVDDIGRPKIGRERSDLKKIGTGHSSVARLAVLRRDGQSMAQFHWQVGYVHGK